MAFGAATILMDTLNQHFLLPTPRFPLRNKTKAKLLYKNLSSLQTCLEQDFKVGEYDEAIMKGLEAELRDVSVELRFQIEQQLTLFYLGKSMKLRLLSAQKLLPILNRAIKDDIQTMDLNNSVLDILAKHFMLPVWRMPAHIKKRVKSFCTKHRDLLYDRRKILHLEDSEDEQESDDEQESEDEQESDDEQESKNEQVGDEQVEGKYEQEANNKQETEEEEKSDDEQESEDEWEAEEEEKSDDEQESKDEQWRNMLYEAESVVRQELRASYLNKYIKQRIQATHSIRKLFMLGIKLTSYIKKELLQVKNANHQSKNSQNNITASLRGPERDDITVGDSLRHTSESTIKMVGCDDEFNTIMDNLNQKSKKREIVSIVGMGGIGKTTLARQIYEDASFISQFDCRAWVTISQEYIPTQVLQTLLHSIAPGIIGNNEASKDKLAMQVYQRLKGQRYVIVIDDIWNTDVWDDLMRCLQDDNNGSRVLLTTRDNNVAGYAASSSSFYHNKQFLGSYESWNLFCNKVSKRVTLSPEFEKIAGEIVVKCKGLPLAIIVAAGILSNSNQTFDEWECIAKNVATLSLDHSNQQRENIIDLSYTFLPHRLKLCFLSFGCFPEDYEVDEDTIVDFWVSEGFLKVLGSKSLEDVARECIQDLVDKNLVVICGEKEYQMHDVLRELALREAQKENLLCFKEGPNVGLSLRYKRIQPKNSSSITYTSNTSSLIDLRRNLITIRRALANLKFLRALAVYKYIDVDNIFLEIVGLVHLRWLNISCSFGLNLHSLPLFMLWNLQKLQVYSYSSREPLDIWGLPQLRNLSVDGVVTLVPPKSVHHNLESIRYLDYRSCTNELFMRIPNLRTLEVSVDDTIDPKCKAPNWFESLVCLYKLEELVVDVKAVRGKYLLGEFTTKNSMGMFILENFLPNLKKLEMWHTQLKWKDVDVFGTLPKLEVLKLMDCVFYGQKWEPKDEGFRRLKLLEICGGNIQCWETTSDHFPVLEYLALSRIELEEIPSDFANIATLKSIDLFRCSESAISSAELIREEQHEYGNDAFVVNILWSDFNLL